MKGVIDQIHAFERLGATIHALAVDVSHPSASSTLLAALDRLSLPPVRGVVHAAGVLGGSLLLETRRAAHATVFAPKIAGALALHAAFPPLRDRPPRLLRAVLAHRAAGGHGGGRPRTRPPTRSWTRWRRTAVRAGTTRWRSRSRRGWVWGLCGTWRFWTMSCGVRGLGALRLTRRFGPGSMWGEIRC